MKLRIKSEIWNIRKLKTPKSKQQKEKRIQKKMRIVEGASGTTSSMPAFTYKGARRRRERARK